MAGFKISWFWPSRNHTTSKSECLKMTTFKIVFTFDGFFLVLKPHALQGDVYFI